MGRKSPDSLWLTCCLKWQMTFVSLHICGTKKYGMTCPLWCNGWQVTIDPNSGCAHPISRSRMWVWINLRLSSAVRFALNTLKILNNRDLVVITFLLDQNILSKNSCALLTVTWEWHSLLFWIQAKTVAWPWPDRHLTVSVSQCCHIFSAIQWSDK